MLHPRQQRKPNPLVASTEEQAFIVDSAGGGFACVDLRVPVRVALGGGGRRMHLI